MAFTYGSIGTCKLGGGDTSSYYQCRLGYEVTSQDTQNNTSTVKLQLEVRSTNSSYATYGYNQTTTIDGTNLSAKTFDMSNTNVWQIFGTRTITVSHNSDGTYSASKNGSFTTTADGTYSLKSGSASVTVKPKDIPRYANFTSHNVSSVGLNSIAVTWKADTNVSAVQYSLNGGSWQDTSGETYTIKNLAPNTSYNIRTRIKRSDSGLWTESTYLYATTKDIAKISSANNFEHGNDESITITNPAQISNLSLAMKIGDIQILTRTVKEGTNTIKFTDAELDKIYKLYGNNNTLTATFTLSGSGYTNSKTATITFKGNQKTGWINTNGSWKRCKKWINVNGNWKRCVRWINVNGIWKRCM